MEFQTLLNFFSFLSGSGFDFCFVVKPFRRDILRKALCENSVKSWFLIRELKKLLNDLAFHLKVYQNNETLRKYSHYWCSTKVNTQIFTFT